MKFVTIARHAKSSWDNVGLKDIDRPLAERGLNDISKIENYLKQQAVSPDLVLSSTANRAFNTAKGICKIIDYPIGKILTNQDIYYKDEYAILSIINNINNIYNDIFVFGHEPKCSYLVELLTGEWLTKFPTCAMYRIAFDIDDWKELNNTTGQKEFFVYPKMF